MELRLGFGLFGSRLLAIHGAGVGHRDLVLNHLTGLNRISGRGQRVGNRWNRVDGFGVAGLGQNLPPARAKTLPRAEPWRRGH
jgi:hypothetical protein